MTAMNDVKERFSALVISSFQKEVLKKLVFSRPIAGGAYSYKKITGRLCAHRGRRIFALEATVEDTVRQFNVREEELSDKLGELISSYAQINLLTTASDAEYKLSKRGEAVILGAQRLERKLSGEGAGFERAIEDLDRRKNYILDGSESFLIELGVSSRDGRVHDKKQGKFRQINKFLEYTEEIYRYLPSEGELTVYDLCCGKSYLSFALYYYLSAVKGRRVNMLGADLKREVIDFCSQTAAQLGFSGMKFICDDITNLHEPVSPDLVISLHACDIATDIVLDTAVKLGAKVILSTPCCHNNLSLKISSRELSFVTKYPKLRGKLCEALTDALRLELLEANGYSVGATELVDPEDTPKNTLIRAVLTGAPDKEKLMRYDGLLEFLMGDGKTGYLPFTR